MKPKEFTKEYQCEHCKGIFQEGWTEEQAQAEYEQLLDKYPIPPGEPDDTVRLCDPCYKELLPLIEQQKSGYYTGTSTLTISTAQSLSDTDEEALRREGFEWKKVKIQY